nr:MAG TPA: hypothetical protein [Caudoviricetes sp.]
MTARQRRKSDATHRKVNLLSADIKRKGVLYEYYYYQWQTNA